MKRCNFSYAVPALSLLFTASVTPAQTISSQKGLTTIEYVFKEATVKVYLPDDIRPGDVISGTVVLEPAGKSTAARNKSLQKAAENNILIGPTAWRFQKIGSLIQKTRDRPGSYRFKTTADFPFAVSVVDAKGTVLQQPVTVRTNDVPPLQKSCLMPSHVLIRSPCSITGQFDGDLGTTQCSINSQPAEILAESPRQCIIQVPKISTGVQEVKIAESGKEVCAAKTMAAELLVTAGRMDLGRGETSYIDVTVTGLDQLKDTATLTITNLSTEIIAMAPLNTQITKLAPDSFVTRSLFSKRYTVTGIRPGLFNVNVNLDLPAVMFDLKTMENKPAQNPGSYGWRGGDLCETKGPITWRWHRTLPCAIELKVEEYGVTPEDKEVIDFIIDQFKKLSKKGGSIGEKMAKCFSFKGKSFWIFARCYRDWDDWDVTYECVNGIWVQTAMVHVQSGRDNLSGWIKLMNAGGNYDWLPTDSFDWVIEGISKSVFCCD
jgi:hypothetical protein